MVDKKTVKNTNLMRKGKTKTKRNKMFKEVV